MNVAVGPNLRHEEGIGMSSSEEAWDNGDNGRDVEIGRAPYLTLMASSDKPADVGVDLRPPKTDTGGEKVLKEEGTLSHSWVQELDGFGIDRSTSGTRRPASSIFGGAKPSIRENLPLTTNERWSYCEAASGKGRDFASVDRG